MRIRLTLYFHLLKDTIFFVCLYYGFKEIGLLLNPHAFYIIRNINVYVLEYFNIFIVLNISYIDKCKLIKRTDNKLILKMLSQK